MKYRTTSKHPYIKEGLEVEYDGDLCNSRYYPETPMFGFSAYDFNNDLVKGYIEEIQEPEFTENQVLDIILFSRNISDRHIEDAKKVLSDYKELKAVCKSV